MKKKFTLEDVLFVLAICIWGYLLAGGGSGWFKAVEAVVGALFFVYSMLAKTMPNLVEFIHEPLRKIYLVRRWVPPPPPVKGESPYGNKLFPKIDVLAYTWERVSSRQKHVKNDSIYRMDFDIEPKSQKRKPVTPDRFKDLKTAGRVFRFITGKSGSGKSFQLIKLIDEECQELNDIVSRNREEIKEKKIPLYIELKYLNDGISSEKIAEYVQLSSASSKDNQIEKKVVEKLIDGDEVNFYFDGLDEVRPQQRRKYLSAILTFKKGAIVYVSCRKEVFDELRSSIEGWDYEELLMDKLDEADISDIISKWTYSEAQKQDIKAFISNKPTLLESLSRRIVLNLFLLAYPELTEQERQDLKTADQKMATNILWQKSESKLFANSQLKDMNILDVRTYLVWAAKVMGEYPFYVESIQPNWLRRIDAEGKESEFKLLQRVYFLVTRINASLVIGLALSLIISTVFAFVPNSILGGLTVSLLAGTYKAYRPTFSRGSNWKNIAGGILFSIGLVIILTSVCGIYQGFAVPRADTNLPFSPSETWPGILLGFVLSTMLSYRIVMEKRNNQYILPVKLFRFNWGHAIIYGISWGVISGFLTGNVALMVKHRYGGNLFINNWLIPFLNDFSIKWRGSPIPVARIDHAIFLYAFCVTFLIAVLLISIFAGRYEDPDSYLEDYEKDEEPHSKKKDRLFGIYQTLYEAFTHALRAGVISTAAYALLIYGLKMHEWHKLLPVGTGVFLLAFLWYGGMEAVNHALLRKILYNRRIVPSNFSSWARNCTRVGVINQLDYRLSFYHSSLVSYYADFKLLDNPAIHVRKKSRDLIYYCLFASVFVMLMSAPFVVRYGLKAYWKSPYEGVAVSPEWTKKINDSVYSIERSGQVTLRARSWIYVGTFVGVAHPIGLRSGFMGMPLKKAYNLSYLDTFRHAALLYRIDTAHRGYSRYDYIKDRRFSVSKGDRLLLVVNDKEYQNNLWQYSLNLDFCDTCK